MSIRGRAASTTSASLLMRRKYVLSQRFQHRLRFLQETLRAAAAPVLKSFGVEEALLQSAHSLNPARRPSAGDCASALAAVGVTKAYIPFQPATSCRCIILCSIATT